MEPILLQPPIELPAATEPVELPPADAAESARSGDGPARSSCLIDLYPRANDESAECSPGTPAIVDDADSRALSARDADATAVAKSVSEQVVLGPSRGPLGQIAEVISYLGSRLFGALTLIVGLAVMAAYPVLQIFSLGYLLECAGRIGRSGRLRDAFPLVPQASRFGGALLGAWLITLPWRFVRDLLEDASLIDTNSPQTRLLAGLLSVLAVLTPLHILFALLRGGRLRYFFWPFNVVWFVRRVWRGGYFREAGSHAARTMREVPVLHYFYLGLRGGLGALAWLFIPCTMYAVGKSGAAGLIGFLGGIVLTAVVLYLPFLQVHFAAENRFRAMFEVSAVRDRFRRAPIAFLIAFLFTLVLVLPLYLLKIEVVPRDALWLPSLVIIVTVFPLKVMTGWAYGRAGRKEKNAHWVFRVPCRLLMLPVALFYAIVVFFTQYTGWEGVRALYEQHAFLLPVAFSSATFSSGQ